MAPGTPSKLPMCAKVNIRRRVFIGGAVRRRSWSQGQVPY
ncbi:hypothetical protein ART_0524 [Arthrobacter sp. PAMC 25486]|nr:hypothetical protein ART_0524 [Arthrobacter sp. PAMC 25486]